MGFYEKRVLPRIINFACGMTTLHAYRERACADLEGRVVEVGFGSGLNIPFYPDTVAHVTAVEPGDGGWRLAHKRVVGTRVPISRADIDAARLPFEDDSFDSALSTWTLCTIPDVEGALAEVRRVLKPGGTLHFIEHGLSPETTIARKQHRFNGLQKKLFGGCHLDRPIADLITGAGFTIKELDNFYEKGAPKFMAYDYLGVAVSD